MTPPERELNSEKPDDLKVKPMILSQLQLILKDISCSSIGLKQPSPAESPFGTKGCSDNFLRRPAGPVQRISTVDDRDSAQDKILGKRKRKTERELKILRSELKKNVMWTRESIKKMRAQYEKDFEMSE